MRSSTSRARSLPLNSSVMASLALCTNICFSMLKSCSVLMRISFAYESHRGIFDPRRAPHSAVVPRFVLAATAGRFIPNGPDSPDEARCHQAPGRTFSCASWRMKFTIWRI